MDLKASACATGKKKFCTHFVHPLISNPGSTPGPSDCHYMYFIFHVGLGLPENYCGVERNYSSTYNCCKINRVIPKVEKNDPLLSSKFYAFGMSNVSLRHYWITAPLYHLPTDVGLTLSKPVNISSVDFQVST